MNKQTISSQQFLTFRIKNHLFAVSLEKILEVLHISQITEVQKMPEQIRGIIHVGRNIIPVINTSYYFGMKMAKDTVNTSILVMRGIQSGKNCFLGVIADEIHEIMEMPEEEAEIHPDLYLQVKSGLLEGVRKVNDNYFMILDLDRLCHETVFE